MKDYINKIICGDNMEVLRQTPDNTYETIITDPPYGLSFMGKKWDYDVPSVELWKECLRVLKPGGTALIFAGSRTQHRMACNVEDAGFELKDCIMWLYGSGFPKATDISKQLDKKAGAERAVIGRMDVGHDITNGGFKDGKTERMVMDITAPATPEAIQWNGWKSHGLKPAYEPIIVAMKPNDGSYAANALKWGVAGLNIDGGRVGNEVMVNQPAGNKAGGNSLNMSVVGMPQDADSTVSVGRFPANIILDEEVAEQAGEWSRYFYCAKASKAERNAGCEGLPEKENNSYGGFVGTLEHAPKLNVKKHNHHPTVKPLALMEYLCKLTMTPTGGIVLDPFAGSGTTGVACRNVGRPFVGIERELEYAEIADCRIAESRLQAERDKLALFE